MPMTPLPDVSSRYGAPMGRPNRDGYDAETETAFTVLPDAAPFYLARVYLDSGGYDSGGAYWGIGEPLYRFEYSRLSDISGYVRAEYIPPENWDGSRAAAWRNGAKAAVRKLHPHARFFR